jgi:hypothetical protein
MSDGALYGHLDETANIQIEPLQSHKKVRDHIFVQQFKVHVICCFYGRARDDGNLDE